VVKLDCPLDRQGRGSELRPRGRRGALPWAGAVLWALAAGCVSLPPHEQAALRQASEQYARGDLATAASSLDRLIETYDRTAEIAEAYYVRGLCRFSQRQYAAAATDFEQAVAKSRRDDLTARAKASLAAIAFQAADWDRAARLYRESVPDLPDAPPTDEILYSAGVALQRVGDWPTADLQFSRILQKFRDRPMAREARRMALWRHPYYAIQLGAYRDADNADKAVKAFRQRGLDVEQENLPRDGQALWVIMTGRYRTYADARAALPRVQQVQRDATIIP